MKTSGPLLEAERSLNDRRKSRWRRGSARWLFFFFFFFSRGSNGAAPDASPRRVTCEEMRRRVASRFEYVRSVGILEREKERVAPAAGVPLARIQDFSRREIYRRRGLMRKSEEERKEAEGGTCAEPDTDGYVFEKADGRRGARALSPRFSNTLVPVLCSPRCCYLTSVNEYIWSTLRNGTAVVYFRLPL